MNQHDYVSVLTRLKEGVVDIAEGQVNFLSFLADEAKAITMCLQLADRFLPRNRRPQY